MNYIEKVDIEKFWGEKRVSIKFGAKENFLIGVNGSGKTTIINLIAATIEGDFATLDRIDFDKITIHLTSTISKTNKSKIIVKKEENDKTPYQNILFQIFKGSVKSFEIYLDDLEEDRLFRHRNYERYTHVNHSKKDLKSELSKLFRTSWLSIHRFRTNFRRGDERSHESLIDQKLYEFSNNFSGYLNVLNRNAKDETDKFQKYIFLSLLKTESEKELIDTIKKINISREKNSLSSIYSLFELKESEYKNDLDNYSQKFTEALTKIGNDKPSLSFVDAEYLIGMKRIHSIIDKWNALLNKQEVIYESRNNFISVINQLLQRKKLLINERNELYIETESGKTFTLFNLSSGEKQLPIIFGEIVLQKSEPHIFIADEPELSLHVEWQEKLVESLKLLNPYAQLIFATHSPDIVGTFQKSVIKIENCIK